MKQIIDNVRNRTIARILTPSILSILISLSPMAPHEQNKAHAANNVANAFLCVSQHLDWDKNSSPCKIIPWEEITVLNIDDEGKSYDNGHYADGIFSGADYTIELTPGYHYISCKIRYISEDDEFRITYSGRTRYTVYTESYEFPMNFIAGKKYSLSVNKSWRMGYPQGPILKVNEMQD